VSRRDRPAKPALTREGIVAAAVAVLRAEGAEKVTMRRLATELDTGPASLYVYVRDTEELHAAVLDELLAGVGVDPATASMDWRERLWSLVHSYGSVLFEHPVLARIALVTRPSGPHYLALIETVLALLAEGGMAPGQAAWAVDVLLLVVTATSAEQGTRQRAPSADREDDALVAALLGATPQTHPHIAALGEDLLSGPGPARSRWAFDVLLNGALTNDRPID
jgi:AcrR family transcriptional regulator